MDSDALADDIGLGALPTCRILPRNFPAIVRVPAAAEASWRWTGGKLVDSGTQALV